jgi:hypothetical protein
MHNIQFVSMMMVIQMKPMKTICNPKKHDDPRISTEHGITIDLVVEVEDARDSICLNDDRHSNETDESHL